ncbi:MAG: hypothetical protein LBK99_16875, partial [Opitutaceae bacterium]|nr:hypothetical protein [Opitutaceae bacterium]
LRLDPGADPGEVSIKTIAILDTLPPPSPPLADDIHIPVPDDLKTSLSPDDDTFAQATLVRYRLSSADTDFAILQNHAGQQKVLKLHLRNSSGNRQTNTVEFAARRMKPFSPVIPPYVGLNAEVFKISVLVDSPRALAGAAIRIGKADGSSRTLPLAAATTIAAVAAATTGTAAITERDGGWREYSFPLKNTGKPGEAITAVSFISTTPPGTDAFVFLAAPTLEGARIKGGRHDLLDTSAPMMTAGMDTPLATQPARPLPARDTISLGGYEIHSPDMAESIPAMAAFMKENFPQWDFVLAPVWAPPLSLFERLPALPEGVFFQFQKAQLVPDYLLATDRMPRNARGEALQSFSNAVLATDPVIQAGLKDEIDYAASLGVNNFKQVDYVWPWMGGRWGYDPATIAAFRDDLQGNDEGLKILPGLSGKLAQGGVIHFWDYYEYYHGFRLNPSDLNLKTWAAYAPVSEQDAARGNETEKRNLGLFVLLYHYEWLRQAQRFGRQARARGGAHSYTLNPEDLGNAGDFVFLCRLVDGGVPYIEYFGGPAVLKGAWHNLPMYVKSADAAGRKFNLILELGQGGHGQHYLSPEINYLYAFELAAAGLRGYHNEWTEASWTRMTDPARKDQYDRWSCWINGALGFTFAREENIRRPDTRVFNISTRSPGYYVSSWIWGVNQGPSFGPLLAENHVPYEQWDRSAMPEILARADVLFYTPPAGGRAQDWKALRQWLKTPGRSLVLHSNIPFSIDDGQARLARNVENVTYTGVDQRYTDFLSEKTDYRTALFPELKAARQIGEGRWSRIPGAEIVLGDKDKPLLSRIALSSGAGNIWYLHRNPLDLDNDERTLVADTLVTRLKLPRTVVSASAPVMAHRFVAPGFDVLDVWTGLHLPGFKGGYGPHLMPGRFGAGEFDPARRPYPYLLPDTAVSIEVPVDGTGEYRVYSFLSGKEAVVRVSPQGTLGLRVGGVSAEQFFFAKDGPGIREKITELKRQRTRLFPYCPDL